MTMEPLPITTTGSLQQPDLVKQKEQNKVRFETELEFVQCLANPFYLQSLAQQDLLTSPPFLAYLTYLTYFRSPRFSRFLQYPQALHHLDLLVSSASFRTALKEQPLLAQELAGKQLSHWAGWRETGLSQNVKGGAGGEGESLLQGANGVNGDSTMKDGEEIKPITT